MHKSDLLQSPKIFQGFTQLRAAQSSRNGGFSPLPFSSLNLGLFTNDEISNVRENRHRFFEALDFSEEQVIGLRQVHGDKILVGTNAGQFEGFDACITNQKNVLLTVNIADCVPVLIYDSKQEVVAGAHAGWRGTVSKIVSKTLAKMQANFGTTGSDCYAFIGTCISYSSFQVDADVADHFNGNLKHWNATEGKFYVDLKSANLEQLQEFGIPKNQIEISTYCTVENNDLFFSHRKEKGKTGRMLGAIGMIDL